MPSFDIGRASALVEDASEHWTSSQLSNQLKSTKAPWKHNKKQSRISHLSKEQSS
jgi:hypothetical protein